jgi:hypothetical protein
LAVTQTLIKEEIDESDYITIQNDETTDNANISQLVFIVRYVKNARIYECFMGFIKPPGHSADVSRVILKELENINIDKTPDKLIAQSYDGAAVMSGQNNGVLVKSSSKNSQF